ncbi:MAG: hypothetical protein U5J63_03120 [Fodinibius sp.]|nr:hypothetical protein [Fodinibius sp.]
MDEYKPAPFLIHEFRNGTTVKQRAAAARKLGHHADNPDLQLAIKDFMSNETEPKVSAALLRSFADITNGATGTEQTFLMRWTVNIRLFAMPPIIGACKTIRQIPRGPQPCAVHGQQNADSFDLFRKATEVDDHAGLG